MAAVIVDTLLALEIEDCVSVLGSLFIVTYDLFARLSKVDVLQYISRRYRITLGRDNTFGSLVRRISGIYLTIYSKHYRSRSWIKYEIEPIPFNNLAYYKLSLGEWVPLKSYTVQHLLSACVSFHIPSIEKIAKNITIGAYSIADFLEPSQLHMREFPTIEKFKSVEAVVATVLRSDTVVVLAHVATAYDSVECWLYVTRGWLTSVTYNTAYIRMSTLYRIIVAYDAVKCFNAMIELCKGYPTCLRILESIHHQYDDGRLSQCLLRVYSDAMGE